MWSANNEISWIGIVAATIVNFFLGGIWFAFIFAKLYALALGKENTPKQKPAPIYLIGPLICGLITTITFAVLLNILKVESLTDAIKFGAFIGFGFLATTSTNTAINPNIPRPLIYSLVSGSFFFVSTIIVSIVLFTFKRLTL